MRLTPRTNHATMHTSSARQAIILHILPAMFDSMFWAGNLKHNSGIQQQEFRKCQSRSCCPMNNREINDSAASCTGVRRCSLRPPLLGAPRCCLLQRRNWPKKLSSEFPCLGANYERWVQLLLIDSTNYVSLFTSAKFGLISIPLRFIFLHFPSTTCVMWAPWQSLRGVVAQRHLEKVNLRIH